MKVPVSWLQDYVDIQLPIEELARVLTVSGLEVDEIHYVGWQLPTENKHGFKINGMAWDKDKIVVAEISEVKQHPNADRLTLCTLFDGRQEHIVLTGAPNLYPYKGQGKLPKTIKVAYAREGASIYDGHADGLVLTTLKRAKIRGVESYSMVCSEKELGISLEHEGVILLDDDAPVGAALADYIGDAVLDVSILPNNARNANILGVAREVAALTGQPLKKQAFELLETGQALQGQVSIDIRDPHLNPRFTLGLIRDVEIKESPYWVQRRLRLAGMRPISNIVDATNYTMIEIGQPLHAFDYDVLKERAAGKPVRILTRAAADGEKLTTLDNAVRTLNSSNVLVCDEKGPLSMAGVMGGQESEIYDASKEVLDVTGPEMSEGRGKASARARSTSNILLEAAAWNFINIRRTANAHNLHSEAAYRFSRGVHPAMTLEGLRRCLYWMAQWSGGSVAPGIVDEYPLPPVDPLVEISERDAKRALGIDIPAAEIAEMLSRLEFKCAVDGDTLQVQTPPFRTDIGEGVVGVADIMEEVARLYGLDRIPETRMADPLPPQRGNPSLEAEDRVRDILAGLGLQEVITHRMTAPEIESRLLPKNTLVPPLEYVKLANPIAPEKRVLRRSVMASVLNVIERNARLSDSLAMFEIGPVFIPVSSPGAHASELPLEPRRLSIALSGRRYEQAWDTRLGVKLDFYDLKGIIEALMAALHLNVTYAPAEHPSFHPGKCAAVLLDQIPLGVFGELHPLVQENYDFSAPVVAADLDLEVVMERMQTAFDLKPVSEFPPVLEDIAVIVDEGLPADRVEALIRQTGGKLLASVHLFDVFRSEQVGAGKKSLAYAMVYQSPDGTLTDKEASQIRHRIIQRLDRELGAKLRS
jgi:phenylalanyl-tRNA synthetase beta chain